MSIAAIVFSRDRPAQLDLLLRSLSWFAPEVFDPITVLYKATADEYREGYADCAQEHPAVRWREESDFREDFAALYADVATLITTFCDDDVLYRPLHSPQAIDRILATDPSVLCVSLRLGQNTGICYPHGGRLQGLPFMTRRYGGLLSWDWRTGDGDFSYPGSLDGHVWRSHDFRALISGRTFRNPNTLEDALVAGCAGDLRPTMACYPESVLVGIPSNRVADSHDGNRYGETHYESERFLNLCYLEGKRLDLAAIRADLVTAAHTEFKLRWQA